MREIHDDDGHDWTTTGDLRMPRPTRPFTDAALLKHTERRNESVRRDMGALAGTRSDWLLHGRERAEGCAPLVSPSAGGQTLLACSNSADTTESDLDGVDVPTSAFLADDEEEFLTVDELSDALRFVERAPRTPRASVIDPRR